MYDLETVSHHMTNFLLKEIQINRSQKAKVEYGLALVLGVLTELILTVGIAFIIGTTFYTLLIMLASLVSRIFTAGTHCTSFRRCLIFTVILFIGVSLAIKACILNVDDKNLMLLSLGVILTSLTVLVRRNKRFALVVLICSVVLFLWDFQSPLESKWLGKFALPISTGIAIQAFMIHKLGQKLVLASDNFIQRLGI